MRRAKLGQMFVVDYILLTRSHEPMFLVVRSIIQRGEGLAKLYYSSTRRRGKPVSMFT